MKPISLVAALGGLCLLAGCGGGGSSSSSGPNPPANLVGSWGGGTAEAPAALSVMTTGGTLSFACGVSDTFTQPLVVDGQGNFDVAATQMGGLPMAGPPIKVHLTGTVNGRTMTLREMYVSGAAGTAVSLTFGQAAPQFDGACPA